MLDHALFSITQEKLLKIKEDHVKLIIGIPRETHNQEMRVSLTPSAVGVLVANGHQVIVEHHAGRDAQFSDQEYSNNGANIAYSKSEVYSRSSIICKINPIAADEIDLLQENQTLISAVHLGEINPDYLKLFTKKNITAIGFEFLQAADGTIPVMLMMSEIAGITSIHIASELLSRHTGGKGILLGGMIGVPPAQVAIIGAGTVGFHAARTAMGLGATIKVIDEEISKLRRLQEHMGTKIYTAVSQTNYIEEAVTTADVVIGATHRKGRKSPCVINSDMVANMKDGSVIVDVAIDQGGCVETSRITTHQNPTFTEFGVIHYCVPNIASRVSRTASLALSNILTPLLIQIGDAGGLTNYIRIDPMIKSGIYVYQRHITQRALAHMFNFEYMDIDLLVAAHQY
jgi:alanine dehydrogenase